MRAIASLLAGLLLAHNVAGFVPILHHRNLVDTSLDMIAPQQLGFFEPLAPRPHPRPVQLQNLLLPEGNRIDFHDAWDIQRQLLGNHLAGLPLGDDDNDDTIRDTVLWVQHAPVYTLGTGSDPSFVTDTATSIPVVRMDRGGEVTYHGPGQLTVYPILDLRHYRQDIHWYVRALEEVVILALQECGLESAMREDGVTGVWVDGYKVAAVGVKCKRWITQHGLAINVTPESLANFSGIVPCGLEGRKVGCIQQFLDDPVTVEQVALYVRSALEDVFQISLPSQGD